MSYLINPFRFGGGGSGPPTARYWRWFPLARPAGLGALSLAEIQMFDTPGGTNLCLGKSYSASSGTASNAFDGNINSTWQVSQQDYPSQWIRCDFGAPVTPVECGIQADPIGGLVTPTVWLIQRSDDDATWVSVSVLEYGAFAAGETKIQPVTSQDMTDVESNARGRRVYIEAIGSGNEARIFEISFHQTFGGASLGPQMNYAFASKTPTGAGSAGRADRAFDGDLATHLVMEGSPLIPAHVGFIRAAPVGVMEEMRITPTSMAAHRIIDCREQWSVDGFTWHTKKAFTGITGWSNGVPRSFDLR